LMGDCLCSESANRLEGYRKHCDEPSTRFDFENSNTGSSSSRISGRNGEESYLDSNSNLDFQHQTQQDNNISRLSRYSSVGRRVATNIGFHLLCTASGRRSSTSSISSSQIIRSPLFSLPSILTTIPFASPSLTSSPSSIITTTAATTISPSLTPLTINPTNSITNGSTATLNMNNSNPLTFTTTSPSTALSSTGIRSLSVNPSRTFLAVGSGDPYQVVIY